MLTRSRFKTSMSS